MNVAFFGTSDRSLPLLKALKRSKHNLVLCVTKKDSKVGRQQILKPSAVKTWAKESGVQFVTIDSLNAVNTRRIATKLKEKNVALGVVADFGLIIPKKIYDFPKHKLVNVHFSLLPKYRGASPVQFAILNRDKKTGITYQIVGKKMDAGPILKQTEYKLSGAETAESLYNTLFRRVAKELPEVLKAYVEGKIKPKKQKDTKISYTYSPSHPGNTHIFKEDAKIDWKKTPVEIDAMVRAFNPWPIAWTALGELKRLKKGKNPSLKVKIHDSHLKKGKLVIKKIQVEGKKIIGWKEFENGYLDSATDPSA